MAARNNVMVDLETMGNTPGCAIIAIGAVEFSVSGGLGRSFYTTIDLSDACAQGLHMDPSTVQWWMDQDANVRRDSMRGIDTLKGALEAFGKWLVDNDLQEACLWGNGSDFDNVLLTAAYKAIGWATPPWKFYANRCYRTLKGMFPDHKIQRLGDHHNALDDAKSQALHACALLGAVERTSALVSSVSSVSEQLFDLVEKMTTSGQAPSALVLLELANELTSTSLVPGASR